MGPLFGFLITMGALGFCTNVVRMAMRHNERIMRHRENMMRIEHNLTPIETEGEWVEEDSASIESKEKYQ